MEDKVRQLGRAIARQRKAAGLTQVQVAASLGVRTVTVSRMENGAIKPTMVRLAQLRSLFDCEIGDFFDFETDADKMRLRRVAQLVELVPEEKHAALLLYLRGAGGLLME